MHLERNGFSGVSIDQLCQHAGLTRGTFYAHFPSKAALLRAVLDGPHDLVQRLRARTGNKPTALAKAGAKVAQDYLNPKNRPAVLGGCSLASLAMDTARGGAAAQAAYADTIATLIQEFQRGGLTKESAETATALCIGGLLVGAACGQNPAGDAVAKAASKQVKALLAGGT